MQSITYLGIGKWVPLIFVEEIHSAQVKEIVISLEIGGRTKRNHSNGTGINITGCIIFLMNLDVGPELNFSVVVIVIFDPSYKFTWDEFYGYSTFIQGPSQHVHSFYAHSNLSAP